MGGWVGEGLHIAPCENLASPFVLDRHRMVNADQAINVKSGKIKKKFPLKIKPIRPPSTKNTPRQEEDEALGTPCA